MVDGAERSLSHIIAICFRMSHRSWGCMSKQHRIFRVIFLNQGERYEVYAKQVSPSDMYGFVEVGDFLFGSKSELLVDPSEERLKQEFDGVKSTYIPMHAVIRIDEVEKEGKPRIVDGQESTGKVTPFPSYPADKRER